MTLVEFLLARYGEDEAVARAATPGPWGICDHREVFPLASDQPVTGTHSGGVPYPAGMRTHGHVTQDSEGISSSVGRRDAAHIARHDPARVLADLAAKRALVALHDGIHECPEHRTPTWVGTGWEQDCETLALLAQPYRDHPDYRSEWATRTPAPSPERTPDE